MAEDQGDRSTEDLLDEPSSKRVEEFREKGQVPQSRELAAVLVLFACGLAIMVSGQWFVETLFKYFKNVMEVDLLIKNSTQFREQIGSVLLNAVKMILLLCAPVALAGFVVGVLSSLLQTGPIITFEQLKPDFSRIDPLKGLQKFIGTKMLVEGTRIIVKAIIVIAVAYNLMNDDILNAKGQILLDPSQSLQSWFSTGRSLFFFLASILLVFSGVDYWFQRKEYMKQVRMTKQEAKQESKEQDGDPMMKARIRSIQRESARRRMMQAVKEADVIVTNPTHIAIAIKYDREKMGAPKVVAKGADILAQKIKEVALAAGVPLVENVPLARTLYKTVNIGHGVPRALYQAVAEVLAYVYRLKNRRF